MLTRLEAIQTQTRHLPIIPLPTEVLSEHHSDKPGRIDTITHFLKNLVVVHYKSEPLQPKPTLAYEAMLRATVRLNIQEAEWSILERNNTVYHLALAQAMMNLKDTFLSEATATQALIQQIKQLDTIQLHTDPIIPEQGLTALNHLIRTSTSTRSSSEGENV